MHSYSISTRHAFNTEKILLPHASHTILTIILIFRTRLKRPPKLWYLTVGKVKKSQTKSQTSVLVQELDDSKLLS